MIWLKVISLLRGALHQTPLAPAEDLAGLLIDELCPIVPVSKVQAYRHYFAQDVQGKWQIKHGVQIYGHGSVWTQVRGPIPLPEVLYDEDRR